MTAGLEQEAQGAGVWLLDHYGLPGLVIIGLVVWLYLKDRAQTQLHKDFRELYERNAEELKEERDARIEDAKAGTELLLRVQSATSETVQKLHTMFEALKTRIR